MNERGDTPRVMLVDLERSPNIGLTWGKWEQDVVQFLAESQVISVAWKILGESETHVKALCDLPGYKPGKLTNGKAMAKHIRGLWKDADVVVGHNLLEADDKWANTEMMLNFIDPPPPHMTVDTLRVLRSKFSLNSNRLDDACQRMGIGRKLPHSGIEMWIGCMNGDPKAWDLMKRYNVHDVDPLLEGLYLRVRPWMTHHPSMIRTDIPYFACPTCREKKLKAKGWRQFAGGYQQYFQCQAPACGKWCHGVIVKGELRLRQ